MQVKASFMSVSALFPPTESAVQTVAALNKCPSDQFEAALRAVAGVMASGEVPTYNAFAVELQLAPEDVADNDDLRILHAGITFLLRQLSYFILTPETMTPKVLSTPVMGDEEKLAHGLSEERCRTISAVWQEKGKAIVQQLRKSSIRNVVGNHERCYIQVAAQITMTTGACEAVDEEAAADADDTCNNCNCNGP